MIPDFRHDLPLLYAGGTGLGTTRSSVGETGVLPFPDPAATADLQVDGPVARTPGVFSTV